jgi:hypothetical protein
MGRSISQCQETAIITIKNTQLDDRFSKSHRAMAFFIEMTRLLDENIDLRRFREAYLLEKAPD